MELRTRLALAVTLLLAPVLARAQDASLKAEQQGPIVARVLAYDRNLKTRAGDKVVIGVLFDGNNPASKQVAEEIFGAFSAMQGSAVQGLPIRVTKLAFGSVAALNEAIRGQKISTLYVAPGLEAHAAEIRGASRSASVLTVASTEESVAHGFSVAVVSVDGRPKIVLNLAASEAEGANFASELLPLVKLVK